jgi:lipopolysaccharide exporter
LSSDPNATLAQRSANALGWSWAGASVRAALQFIVQVLLARWLGPEAFGQAAAALLVVGLGALVAEAGLSAALVQREQLSDDDVAVALGRLLLYAGAVSLVLAVLAGPIALWLGHRQLTLLVLASALIVPLQALSTLPAALLQRQLRIRALQAVQLGSYVIAYAGLGLALAYGGAGPWAVLAAFALHAVLATALAWWAVRHSLRPRWRGALQLRRYAHGVLWANLVNWGLESVDRLMVSRGWGAAALGEYSVAANLARAPVTLLVSSAQPVAFASAARLQNEAERIGRGYIAVLSLAMLTSLPLFGFLAWHAPTVVAWLYGPRWAGAAAPFAVMCLGVPCFVMLALTGPMLRGVDAVGHELRAQGAVLLGLMVALWFVQGQSLVVVASVVALATALRAAVLFAALAHRIGLPLRALWPAWRGGLLLSVAVVLVSWLMQGLDANLALPLAAAAGALLCAALLRWSRGALFGPELYQALRNRRGDSRGAAALCAWARVH